MKTALLIVTIILASGIGYLSVTGSELQEISTEIEISASPDKVWTILVDIDNWHEWSPIIKASSGKAALGSELTITMIGKEEGQDGATYHPKITDFKEGYLKWQAHMLAGFIFTNYKVLELKETPNGTLVTHKELFKGLMAPIICGQMEVGVPPMLDSMNQALKQLAER